jgi:hypothetical protein
MTRSSVDDLSTGDEVRWSGRENWLTVVENPDKSGGRIAVEGPQGGRYVLWDMPNGPHPDYHVTHEPSGEEWRGDQIQAIRDGTKITLRWSPKSW